VTAVPIAPVFDEPLRSLLTRARALYGEVKPCSGKTWQQCISYHNGQPMLWFNDKTGSTRLVHGERVSA